MSGARGTHGVSGALFKGTSAVTQEVNWHLFSYQSTSILWSVAGLDLQSLTYCWWKSVGCFFFFFFPHYHGLLLWTILKQLLHFPLVHFVYTATIKRGPKVPDQCQLFFAGPKYYQEFVSHTVDEGYRTQ